MKNLFTVLEKAPDLLEEMIDEIPEPLYKIRRISGKWSIHEHVCHLAEAQKMIIGRFERFKNENNPEFAPYLPGTESTPDNYLIGLDLKNSLLDFRESRAELLALVKTFHTEDWQNEGKHPEYKLFNPRLFLRHVMMHDHFHMYRIEELWLTTDEYLRKG